MNKWLGTGGLWLKEGFKASDTAPRWRGQFTCTCGKQHNVEGWGRDQTKSDNPKAPTIKLRVRND